ncbi:MAG: extracellular solute-binding protein [Spirochaetia bacterium]|nr:extracellular solute-binding protein [Spirochaetia bacterium]
MNKLFLTILTALILFTHAVNFRNSRKVAVLGTPKVYWATAVFASRPIQMAAFSKWLAEHGHPPVNLTIDPGNQGVQKLVVQGVAGVGADCVDLDLNQVPYVDEVGLARDQEPIAREFGFSTDEYLPYVNDILRSGNRLLAAPFSPFHMMYVVNEDAFEKLGMNSPPERWTFEQFESIGVEYVKRANAGKKRRDSWFSSGIWIDPLIRSLGLSYLNETLSAGTLNDARTVKTLERVKYWKEVLHLLPTAAETSSLFSGSDVNLSQADYLIQGRFAMLWTGRFVFTALRAVNGTSSFTAVEPPHGGIPNTLGLGRVTVLNMAGKNNELARYFMAFISSDDFSAVQADTADGMPPLKRWLTNDRLLRPVGHTNEWKGHAAFTRGVSLAMVRETSPFCLTHEWQKEIAGVESGYYSGVYTAPEAARIMQEKIQQNISKYLSRHPERKPAYEKALAKQKSIDAIKARGEKVPAAMIDNPALRRLMLEGGKAF